MKTLFIFLCSLFVSLASPAQTIVKDAIVVNGLQVGQRYTQEVFVKALGTPTKIEPPKETDAYENAYTFYYGEDCFYWIGGEFYGFDLWTPAFAVNGLIRVGDNISKVDMFGGVKRLGGATGNHYINWRPTKDGLYEWASVNFYYNEQNIIVSIDAFISDL